MNIERITDQLITHEGYRKHPYLCTAGKTTIGVGRNISDVGITKEEAMYLLSNDIRLCTADLLKLFLEFDKLPENIKMVLIDMRFQLGPNRLRKFRKAIAAVRVGDWLEMIVQMKDSRWYKQTTNRANNLIGMVLEVENGSHN